MWNLGCWKRKCGWFSRKLSRKSEVEGGRGRVNAVPAEMSRCQQRFTLIRHPQSFQQLIRIREHLTRLHFMYPSRSKLFESKHNIYHVASSITSHHAINILAAFLIWTVTFQASSSASLSSFSALTSASSLSASALAFPFPGPLFFFLVVLDGVASSPSSSSPSSVAKLVS